MRQILTIFTLVIALVVVSFPQWHNVEASYRPSVIKSIQRGTINLQGATSNTATITAVTTANSVLSIAGRSSDDTTGGPGQSNYSMIRGELTNSTTVTAYRITDDGVGASPIIPFEVVEYYSGVIRSIQRGTITLNASTSGTATITSVTTGKTQLYFLGATVNATGYSVWAHPKLVLTNATTVTASVGGIPGADVVVGYQAVEFR